MDHRAANTAAAEMHISAQHVEMVVNTYLRHLPNQPSDEAEPFALIAKGGGYFTITGRAVITETVRGRDVAEARIAELLDA